MGKLNATILLRSDTSTNWLNANPILALGEAGYETNTHKLKIGNGTTNWKDLNYIAGESDLVVQNKSIETVEKLPPEGDASFFYKVKSTSLIYFWDNDKFIAINEKQEIPDPEPQIDNIIVANTKDGFPANGENNKLYKSLNDQLIYSWNSQNNSYEKIKAETVSQINNIKLINTKTELPDEGNPIMLYKVIDTDLLYTWNQQTKTYQAINETVEMPEIVQSVKIVNTVVELPNPGNSDTLYKVLENEEVYTWNASTNTYKSLMEKTSETPIVEGKENIAVVDTIANLPTEKIEDILYKVKENQKFYYWNDTKAAYEILNETQQAVEGKSNILVVNKFDELPEIGEADVLYKVVADQALYNYNTLTKAYEKLGQAGGGTIEEGYNITLQSTIDRIFAALEGNTIELKFRYSSVDQDGLNDGPGIGTLIVNDVKKTTIAVAQKLQTFDITKYLVLGDNDVQLIVENSDGKQKTLTYSISVINLQLTTNFKSMDIYTSDTSFAFVIIGSGTKTLHYLMDGNELYNEEITSTNKLAYSYKIPMQTAGAHIFTCYATMETNNMSIQSNTLTLGMMYVTDEMVDTHILSTFQQTESTQGEIITIPYMVYNPFLETTNVKLEVINPDNSIYFTKEIIVNQTTQNWVIQDYPAGQVIFCITASSDSGTDAIKEFHMTIHESTFDLSIVNDNIALEFTANGRSNTEKNPAQWNYNDIDASFGRFMWSGADGWVESDAGETVLRFLPKDKMTIPFYPFATDKRSNGYTMEFELSSHNVNDYDSVIVSCVNEGRGFIIKSQSIIFKSEQSKEIVMMFKEDERVRITVIIEPQTLNRFIYMYINGIICAVEQYPENDNFKQSTPQPITLGSDTCGLDLYKMRFYNRNLTMSEQLNNYICDRSTNGERLEIEERNHIYDISGNLTIGSLPKSIPYLVMQCEELPQYKGDKKKNKSAYFVDNLHPERNFSATGCQFNVQGTSSAVYPVKNFKVAFKKGITYSNGDTAKGFPIEEGDLLAATLCLKADYASSEHANNTVLVDYYDTLVRDIFKTPPQETNNKVRTGIKGIPIVVFWENTETGEVKFQGMYNMNNDKSNENVFGFDSELYPNLECWEFSNNTSDRTLFKKSEFEETYTDTETGKVNPAWMADFEARYPDLDEPYSNYTQFKRVADWIVSTDRRQATGNALSAPITYGETTYTNDTEEYRLDKFKYEINDYLIKDDFIFYYIFTEVFLMIDSRAKNMFFTTFDGTHWFLLPYDFDTAIGINNEGALVFDYDLEDTDKVNNEDVFNGQESTLWLNIRDAFKSEIYTMYDKLRTAGKFSYEAINTKMNEHQSKCWPEALWNEDAKLKYLDVYLTDGEEYFDMCQGNKRTQREWWLYNTFKYRDSKYRTGDAQKMTASFRAYSPEDMTVTPYQHLWPRVDFTDSYPVTQRSKRNVPNLMKCPIDTASDTEIFIRSSDRISSFGDLSNFKPDTVKFGSATKLREVILGSNADGYTNHKLTSVELGNNKLLDYLNVENCINLVKAIDLSNCVNLETVKTKGSSLTSLQFPIGGHLTNLELPGTFTNLTIRNQHGIQNFSMESYDSLNTLWIDDTPNIPIENILLNSPKLDRVRLVNLTWSVTNEDILKIIFNKLKFCGGIDANGNNTETAVVTGYITIDAISDEFLEELNETFKELIVIVNGKTRFFLRYVNWNNDLLYKYAISQGDNAIDPIATGLIEVPTREGTDDTHYNYRELSNMQTNIQGPLTMVALYDTYYRVQFINGDNEVVNTQWIIEGGAATDPVADKTIKIPIKTSDAQYDYTYADWKDTFDKITAPKTVEPEFSEELRSYPVYFYNDSELLQETSVYYGNYASYNGNEEDIKKKVGGEPSDYYEFASWSPSLDKPIKTTTFFYAQYIFNGYIEDSWATIAANVAAGNLSDYGYGGKKKQAITYVNYGKTYTDEAEFEIIGKNHDELETTNANYNNNSTTAGLTFKVVLSLSRALNRSPKDNGQDSALNVGGWEMCDLRSWLNNNFLNALPDELKKNIKSVKRLSDPGYAPIQEGLVTTYDKVAVPSLIELGITNSATIAGQGTPYVMFTDNYSRIITPPNVYWTRSAHKEVHSWCGIDMQGYMTSIGGGSANQVVILICI